MSRRPQLFGKTLFVDLMMSTLVVVTALLIASSAVEKEKAQQKEARDAANLRTEGKYAIVMEWPDASPDDVDLYVQDPTGKVVYFSARDLGLMHLEHDDQGAVSDRTRTARGVVAVEKNEERVILRGVMPGEYVVNVHMYDKRDPQPTPVTISLYRLRGEDAEIVKKERVLRRSGDEATAFRFTVKDDETVGEVNELDRSLVGGAKGAQSGGGPRFRFGGGF
ncbi:MAG TPA: hypothetical protein VLC10_02300 [Patescibacteria group bacterium]|nr:hypothetical protein [Patescibacteria group bacterium]